MIKILVVDDDRDLLEMVAMMLSASQMEVRTLSTGKLVLPTIEKEIPDLVLMDIFLGDSDGRHLCKQIKTIEQYAGIPVVLYSAGEITKASIEEAAADYFIRKPFDMHQLVQRIRQSVKDQ